MCAMCSLWALLLPIPSMEVALDGEEVEVQVQSTFR